MNLPNKLTVLRMLLVPVFVVLFEMNMFFATYYFKRLCLLIETYTASQVRTKSHSITTIASIYNRKN